MDWLFPTIAWYLTTTAIALAVAPVVALLFRNVTDRGASLVRPISLLLTIWPVWLLASLGDGIVPFDRAALWVTTGMVTLLSWSIGRRAGVLQRQTLVHYGIAETGYLALFGGFVFLRGFIPAVGGPGTIDQEKPMDLMMLASSMRSSSMPPMDAWLAGETINYYYLGYAIWAAIGTMIGTTPAITYNLAIVSVIAMTTVALVGTIANMLSRFTGMAAARVGGIVGVVLVAFIGTPWAAWEIGRDPAGQWQRWPFDGVMWNATRIIPVDDTGFAISEFPAFSFLFADLHPHLMAIPFTISALGIAWMLASLHPHTPLALRFAQLGLAGLTAVALYAINSWDFPTWFAVIAGGILISPGFRTVSARLTAIVTALSVGIAAWSPFILRFEPPVRIPDTAFADAVVGVPVIGDLLASIAAYSGDRTSLQDWLSIFGFFYPVLVLAIVIALVAPEEQDADGMVSTLAVLSGIVMVAIGVLAPAPLLILLGVPLLGGLVVILRSTSITLELLVVGLGSLSLLLALVPEFFYLFDIFGNRMNTIFKLYLQSWLLGGVATALALAWFWQRGRAGLAARGGIALLGAMVLLAGLSYPVVAASQWIEFKNPQHGWQGMDGLAWLEAGDPAAYEALQWLWDHGTADDVLLAAGGCAYRAPIGLPAAVSGVPAIIGWDNHQRQWRLGDESINAEIERRVTDVVDLFARPTEEVLDRYGVTLLYIGRIETAGLDGAEATPTCAPGPFPEATSPEFPGPGWIDIFDEDGIRILRRVPD